jgi:hypothetical protein
MIVQHIPVELISLVYGSSQHTFQGAVLEYKGGFRNARMIKYIW